MEMITTSIQAMYLDDHEANLQVLKAQLNLWFPDVILVLVKNADEALDIVGKKEIHCAFLDVFLQGAIAGQDVARMIQEINGPDFPIMFITGFADEQNTKDLWNFAPVVHKPTPPYFQQILKKFFVYVQRYHESEAYRKIIVEHNRGIK